MLAAIPSTPVALSGVLAVAVLLSQFALLRSLMVEGVVRIYAVQSLAVCVFTADIASLSGSGELYLLASLTLLIKVVAIPVGIGLIVRRLDVEDRVRPSVPVPQSFLLGAGLTTLGFAAATRIQAGMAGVPADGLGCGLAVILLGFLLMIVRPHAIVQLIGFLALENGIFLASLALVPGLPILVAVLLLLDILIPSAAFVVVIRVLAARVRSVHTAALTELRG